METETQKVHALHEPGDQRAAGLQRDLELMKNYLRMCVRKEDWHGVMDASADIREIIAKLGMLG